MSLNPDIIQFVTDTTARLNQKYPAATQQQRLILDKNTGQVFWDVDYTRYKVNTTPKVSYTVNQGSDALVTGNAVAVYVQGIKTQLQQQIDSLDITVDTQLSAYSTNPVQNRVIKAGIDSALSTANQYADAVVSSGTSAIRSQISDAVSQVLSNMQLYTDLKTQAALSSANQYTDSKYATVSSTYVPISSVASDVQISDAHIPTGGAVYAFVQSAIGGITPGAQSLTGLTDTSITNPAGGQALVYNNNTSKWQNKNIQTGSAGVNWIVYV